MSTLAPIFTGAEFKKFIDDPEPWSYQGEPSCFCWDDDIIEFREPHPETGLLMPVSDERREKYLERMDKVPDDAEVTVSYGFLRWQGKGPEPKSTLFGSFHGRLEEVAELWLQAERARILNKQLAASLTLSLEQRDEREKPRPRF